MSEEGFLSFPFFWKRPIWGLSMKWGLPIQVRQQTSKEPTPIQINWTKIDCVNLYVGPTLIAFSSTGLGTIVLTSKKLDLVNYSYIKLDEIQL